MNKMRRKLKAYAIYRQNIELRVVRHTSSSQHTESIFMFDCYGHTRIAERAIGHLDLSTSTINNQQLEQLDLSSSAKLHLGQC